MALILPNDINLEYVDEHSHGEYKILTMLQSLDEKITKDWVIYYSFYFKGKNKFTNEGNHIHDNNEIDFLILAPDLGIFVFEIKGGLISKVDGELYSINKQGKQYKISPYDQAKNNYYSLKNVFQDLAKSKSTTCDFGKFVYSTLVGFPDCKTMPDVGALSNGVDTYVDGMNFIKFLKSNSDLCKSRNKFLVYPTKQDIDEICKILKGNDFVYAYNSKDYIRAINLKIDQLTEEQNTVFRGILLNDRCLVKGKAGTGKTVLCEFLFKHLIYEKKQSAVYFTYNRLIADRINNDINNSEDYKCYPIIEYLQKEYYRFTGTHFDMKDYSKEVINELLKKVAEYNVFYDNDAVKYDCIILDEAQDIFYSEEVECFFDKLLNGGLKNGKLYMFYDEGQQLFFNKTRKIYNSNLFEEYRYAKFELLRNCRNSIGIQKLLTNFQKTKSDKNNTEIIENYQSENVKYFDIKEDTEGIQLIKSHINNLLKDGVKRSQITVLFNKSPNNNSYFYKELKSLYGDYFVEYNIKNDKAITYSTIRSFKGLENDVIFYINDLDYAGKNDHYVALSRAKAMVFMFKVNNK